METTEGWWIKLQKKISNRANAVISTVKKLNNKVRPEVLKLGQQAHVLMFKEKLYVTVYKVCIIIWHLIRKRPRSQRKGGQEGPYQGKHRWFSCFRRDAQSCPLLRGCRVNLQGHRVRHESGQVQRWESCREWEETGGKPGILKHCWLTQKSF